VFINRLDHIGIAVSDVPAAEAFFREILELPVTPGNRGVYVDLGNAFLWVYQSDAGTPSFDPRTTDWRRNPPGIDHFALEVDDIDEAGRELAAKGVIFPDPVVDAPGDIRYRGFEGPSGMMLYLLQQAPSGR
jgi:catechol 2,3-dioxygenase-like lactoylglutathione lyase family enzyme